CKNLHDKWIYNIKNMGIRQEVAFRSNSEIFKRLAEVANVATLTPEQRYHYEADVKNARDTLNQIRGAYQEGEAKGRAEGEAKGRAEGKAEGEADAKKAIARKMLKNGLGISMIASFTGLSESEIESL
ncbi:MAG: PD-(D/E)XK nuclease family transposase, partial [Muribaculaceae bacterium]|nr:PD-(D/E)XK nuclease family transposase [Muribaculaceae bacterium]